MKNEFIKKYKPYPKIDIQDRDWPNRTITKAPIWCSVDLRDGNQALITPMSLEEKLVYFKELLEIGFKEIEVGFPSAAQVEFDFLRKLITENLIPNNVKIQVLVQAREHLIERTFEALKGSQGNILHIYNSTAVNQRKIVFKKNKKEIIDIAVQGVKWVKEYAQKTGTDVVLEYSPESFTGTELDYAVEVCNAVIDEWVPTPDKKIIINLPATVELSMPNIYADQIEWMSKRLSNRENVILSVHTHNDRGTGVAASELALLAGAERVEGTLFGNGERTGNADIVTLALNLYSHGINPGLDFHNINKVVNLTEKHNKIPVPVRHPYAGDLVYTAFSGSHQDAIKKGFEYQKEHKDEYWEVPYLPIDPADLGRDYEGIIRINSQSGKGGAVFVLENEVGYCLPKQMHSEFGKIIQDIADETGRELNSRDVISAFNKEYLDRDYPIKYISFGILSYKGDDVEIKLEVEYKGEMKTLSAIGNGPLDASTNAILKLVGDSEFKISYYSEHALKKTSTSEAIAFVEVENSSDQTRVFGVGIDTSITKAAVKAVINAVNRSVVFS
jgi:2-isopropylmalate synthase